MKEYEILINLIKRKKPHPETQSHLSSSKVSLTLFKDSLKNFCIVYKSLTLLLSMDLPSYFSTRCLSSLTVFPFLMSSSLASLSRSCSPLAEAPEIALFYEW